MNCCLFPVFHLGVSKHFKLCHSYMHILDDWLQLFKLIHSMSCCRVTNPRVEHSIPIIRTSGDQHLREGQLMALHLGPHLGHNHRDELSGGPAGSSVRRPPPILHLLLQRPVITLIHNAGELQL